MLPATAPPLKIKDLKDENILGFIPDDLGVKKVDLRRYIPDSFYIDGRPVYKDNSHWNVFGAEKIADEFVKNEKFIQEK